MNITICTLLGLITASVGLAAEQKYQFSDGKENFERVHEMILKEHMNPVDRERLYQAATQGMLKALNEDGKNWNTLMNPSELEEFAGNMGGEIIGIGVGMKFISETGTAAIHQVIQDSPAQKAGLQIGDQIISVNGQSFRGKDQTQMLGEIRGPEGKKITVKILRQDTVFEKEIELKKIAWDSVETKRLSDNIAMLKIRAFNKSSPALVEKHLKELNNKIKALVLDLRHNNGGIFDMAVASTEHFLPKGKVIAVIRGRDGKTQTLIAQKSPLIQVPIAVLINSNTSAGAELLAVNLKEHLNAQLVGEKSFGKWNSQIIRKLPNNFAVKMTVYEFLSPRQNSYQNVGLAPDVRIAAPILPGFLKASALTSKDEMDPQVKTAILLLQKRI